MEKFEVTFVQFCPSQYASLEHGFKLGTVHIILTLLRDSSLNPYTAPLLLLFM